jgi:hypothetical protein
METMTVRGAAAFLGLSPQAIYQAIDSGDLQTIDGTTPTQITAEELASWRKAIAARRSARRERGRARAAAAARRAGLVVEAQQ